MVKKVGFKLCTLLVSKLILDCRFLPVSCGELLFPYSTIYTLWSEFPSYFVQKAFLITSDMYVNMLFPEFQIALMSNNNALSLYRSKIILDGSKSFWLGLNNFGQAQIRLLQIIFYNLDLPFLFCIILTIILISGKICRFILNGSLRLDKGQLI